MKHVAQRGAPETAMRDLWQSMPLDCILCAFAACVAAGLKGAGVLP